MSSTCRAAQPVPRNAVEDARDEPDSGSWLPTPNRRSHVLVSSAFIWPDSPCADRRVVGDVLRRQVRIGAVPDLRLHLARRQESLVGLLVGDPAAEQERTSAETRRRC